MKMSWMLSSRLAPSWVDVGRQALIGRLFVICLGALNAGLATPYDSSASLKSTRVPTNGGGSRSDWWIGTLCEPFSNWDGVFFLAIAEDGYLYEQFHAFFPLLPFLMRTLRCVRLDAMHFTVSSRLDILHATCEDVVYVSGQHSYALLRLYLRLRCPISLCCSCPEPSSRAWLKCV